MEYCSSAWVAASKSATDCLDATQNQGLRTILAASKSTPILQLEKHCECTPLDTRRKMKSSIQYEKSKRITTHPLRDVFEEKTKNRLKRKSPNDIAREVVKEHKDITEVYQNNWNITLRPCHRTCTQMWKSAKRFLELGEKGSNLHLSEESRL